MKNVKIMLLSLMFAFSGQTFAASHDSVDLGIEQESGIVFTFSEPEMFFTTPNELKLSVIWEILNCFDFSNGTPIDQCVNLEFLVVNETVAGDQLFTSDLEGECLQGDCEAIIRLPLVAVLTPTELVAWSMGQVVEKTLFLHLGFLGEEDDFGRTVGRQVSEAHYQLDYILNATGPGSVAIVGFTRINGLPVQ